MKIKKLILICALVFTTILTALGVASCDRSNGLSTLQAKAEASSSGANSDVTTGSFFNLNYETQLSRVESEYARRYKLTYDLTSQEMIPYESSENGSFVFTITQGEDVKMKVLLEVNAASVSYSYLNYGFAGYSLAFSTNRGALFTISTVSSENTQNWVKAGSVRSNGSVLPYVYGENSALYVDLYGSALDAYSEYRLNFDYAIGRFNDKTITWYESGWNKFWKINPQYCNQFYVVTNMRSEYDEALDYTPSNFYSDDTYVDKDSCRFVDYALRKTGSSLSDLFAEKIEADEAQAKSYFGSYYDTAHNIAYNEVTETVTVRYLKDIEDTPFAYRYEEKIEVTYPRGSTELSLDVLKSAFGRIDKEFPVTACSSFADKAIPNADGTAWEVKYLSSVYVKMRSSDGYSDAVILDPNKSFTDFFAPFVESYGDEFEDGEKVVDYILNDIVVNQYPTLQNVSDFNEGERLYGLWGFSVIPANTLDWIKEAIVLSNKTTDSTEIVNFYDYGGNLSNEQYEALLVDYGYFSLFANALSVGDELDLENATFVFFFANDAGEGVISQNGSTDKDNDNALSQNQIQVGVNNAKDGLTAFWNDIKDMIGEGNANITQFLQTLICLLGMIGFVIVLVNIFKNTGGKNNG